MRSSRRTTSFFLVNAMTSGMLAKMTRLCTHQIERADTHTNAALEVQSARFVPPIAVVENHHALPATDNSCAKEPQSNRELGIMFPRSMAYLLVRHKTGTNFQSCLDKADQSLVLHKREHRF